MVNPPTPAWLSFTSHGRQYGKLGRIEVGVAQADRWVGMLSSSDRDAALEQALDCPLRETGRHPIQWDGRPSELRA
jgi:uncharacterized protein YktB (UPF0637 family)